MSKIKSLRNAKTLKQLCDLKRDNYTSGDFWIIADGCQVTICEQRNGEPAKACVTLPIRTFNRLIDFYNREQP